MHIILICVAGFALGCAGGAACAERRWLWAGVYGAGAIANFAAIWI